MPDKIKIRDTRNVPANKKFNYNVNPELVKKLVMGSNIRNIDPATTLAIALQETGINPINPLHYNSYDKEVNIDDSLDFLKKNYNYAKRLGKTSDADTIQAWNGYGKIKALVDEGKLYGTDKLIDMNKTPLYGERVAALRDSAIMQTPEIVDIIKNYATGGEMQKNTNSKFIPTYINGVPTYMCGGKLRYDLGGMMMPGGMLDMSQEIQQQRDAGSNNGENNAGIGRAINAGGNMIGGVMDAYALKSNDKPYAQKSVGAGALKGAASGASAGMALGPWGAAIGGVVGGVAGALGTKFGNDKAQQDYSQFQQNNIKQQLISNLPAQSSYTPTFANGGELPINQRVKSIDNGSSHEESPYGGVPVGPNALVEAGEYIYKNKQGKKYVFTDKF